MNPKNSLAQRIREMRRESDYGYENLILTRRISQMHKVRAWAEWPAAIARLRELGCNAEQTRAIRRGVTEVVLHGTMATRDPDIAWHIAQMLSVLLHHGYEMLTTLERQAVTATWFQSPRDGAWLVSLRSRP